MSSRFPRAYRQQLAAKDEANITRAVGRNVETTGEGTKTYHRAAVDNRRLRGIPAIGPGVTGAIPGTSPHHAR